MEEVLFVLFIILCLFVFQVGISLSQLLHGSVMLSFLTTQ